MSVFYSLGALIVYTQCNDTQNKESACRRICIMCQQTSPKHWFGNMNMTSNCDVTNSAHQIQMATTCHWMKSPMKLLRTPLYTRNSSCITLLWLQHNHKMSISYHKIGLVSRHQSVGRWLLFCVFCGKNILTKLVGYHQPILVSVSRWNLWLETFRIHVNCIHLRGAVFVHVGQAQLCTENGVSLYMRSAVEVARLAQNIRRSSTRVWFHLQWHLDISSEYCSNNSSYLMIFTSLLHVGFDWVNDSNLIFKTTKNHHAKSTFMLAPLLFPWPRSGPPLF